MPVASQRAQQMPASPIRKLMPYADAAKARGIDVIHLNIGQPDVLPPAEFWEAIIEKRPPVLEYTHSAGNATLRAKARAYYERVLGVQLDDSQLLVTTAGSEAIIFAMTACLNPGDEVIIPEPLYANYLGFAVQSGVKVVPIPTKIEENFALPPASVFADYITPRTKAILICNPSNPTGTIYGNEQLQGLRQIVLDNDLFLFADEVYRDFYYTDSPVTSILQLKGLENHAIMIDSVSKRFSLCGARLGFLVSKNAEIMQGALRMAQARLSPPGLAQLGVEAALDASESYYANVREEYRSRRDLLITKLADIPGILVPQIDGAFYATVRLPIDDSDRFCQWLLESFSYEGKTVMLAPASGFYSTPGMGKDEVRIAYVLKKERIELAVECLSKALAAYPGLKVTA
ncbi:MAG: pyridoxal phosphate-dependent aminotransferase [Armatimonadetes bacterium]|nr:pyridoxal phosphate-dependent aminotransferase [Armatimonadota bacterium]